MNVRLDAKVCVDDVFVGRISSDPNPLSPGVSVTPRPKKSRTMSLRAMVWSASTVIDVFFPDCVPFVCDGVKLTSYVACAPVALVRRTSDWKGPVAPGACVTTGMTSALDGGRPLPPGLTGVTRLTDTDLVATLAPFEMTFSVPVFAPGGRFVGLAVTVTVVPPGGIVPDDGVTVRYGLSTAAVKGTSNACLPVGEGMETVIVTGIVLPTGTTASAARAVTVGV